MTSTTRNIRARKIILIRGNEILKERGYSEEVRRAIMSHAEYTGVARVTPMEKTLFACDELAGFITACALVKPGKSLAEVEAKSVRKKMKDKAFARSVNRDDITSGAAELGRRTGGAYCVLHRGDEGNRGRAGAGRKERAEMTSGARRRPLRHRTSYLTVHLKPWFAGLPEDGVYRPTMTSLSLMPSSRVEFTPFESSNCV